MAKRHSDPPAYTILKEATHREDRAAKNVLRSLRIREDKHRPALSPATISPLTRVADRAAWGVLAIEHNVKVIRAATRAGNCDRAVKALDGSTALLPMIARTGTPTQAARAEKMLRGLTPKVAKACKR